MTTGSSSALVKQADLLATLSRTSMPKHSVFLPLLDVVKHVISKAIQDGEDGDEVDEDEAVEEGTEEGEEDEADSEDDKINDYVRRPEYKVDGYKMGVKEFERLTETSAFCRRICDSV